MVAFAKMSGFLEIKSLLRRRVVAGMVATFVIGVDFWQSEPDVLNELLSLQELGDVSVYMGAEKAKWTFHPKIYLFQVSGRVTAVVGSANLTGGGVAGNHELSALVTREGSGWETEIKDWIELLLERGEVVEATDDLVARYKRMRDIYKAHVVPADKAARRKLSQPTDRLDALRILLGQMRADATESGFDIQVSKRSATLVEASKVLKRIATAKGLSRASFLSLYERLVGGLWHSGGLQRGKNVVAEKFDDFQMALLSMEEVKSKSPKQMFDHLRSKLNAVDRAGTNVITEILHTRDTTKFAVMNQNSVHGMKLAEVYGYPDKPNKKTVDGVLYARFCAEAEVVRTGLDLADFSELDALFNYAYW